MNPAEAQIHYPVLDIPQPGQRTAIAPGVWWLRMPLPFALDHINLWLIEDQFEGVDGFTVIDTGVSTAQTKALWRQIKDQYFDGKPIVRVICTHMHPDHMGLAYWLTEGMWEGEDTPAANTGPHPEGAWEAPLWMTLGEYSTGRIFASKGMANETEAAPDGPRATMAEHFKRHGMTSEEDYQKTLQRKDYFTGLVPRVPQRYKRLLGGQTFQMGGCDWRVIPGYGHSPEHASLYCADKNLLISGDMLLPRISTNMSVWAHEPDGDPLGNYLSSIKLFRDLPTKTLVLPSHGRPFGGPSMPSDLGGIHTRVQQLIDHHDARMADALQACQTPKTCAQVLPVLFPRELDFHQFTFAMGETIAHMNYLWHAGRVSRSLVNGQWQFQAQ